LIASPIGFASWLILGNTKNTIRSDAAASTIRASKPARFFIINVSPDGPQKSFRQKDPDQRN
jgi:hypothetical protein